MVPVKPEAKGSPHKRTLPLAPFTWFCSCIRATNSSRHSLWRSRVGKTVTISRPKFKKSFGVVWGAFEYQTWVLKSKPSGPPLCILRPRNRHQRPPTSPPPVSDPMFTSPVPSSSLPAASPAKKIYLPRPTEHPALSLPPQAHLAVAQRTGTPALKF